MPTSSSSISVALCRLLAVALAIASPSCVQAKQKSSSTFSANSHLGRNLIQKAQVVQPNKHLRRLADNNNYDNYYDYDGDGSNSGNSNGYYYDTADGIADLGNLYIKYLGCSAFLTPDGEAAQASNEDDQYSEYYLPSTSLVRFTLCARNDCSGDCSGEYAVDMIEFLDAYAEIVEEQRQQECSYVRQHCYCSSGYWENCLYNCYVSAGIESCMNDYYNNNNGGEGGGEGTFQLQEYLECREAYGGEGGNNNNNNNNNKNGSPQFFVGPYCANDTQIFLGAYYDQYCSLGDEADADYFLSLNYGSGFPYFSEPILSSNECMSCLDQDGDGNNGNNNNNNNNGQYNNNYQYYYPESSELCQMTTEESLYKCDRGRGYTSGCFYLNTTLPCLDGRGCPKSASGSDSTWSSSSTSIVTAFYENFSGSNLKTILTEDNNVAITAVALGIIVASCIALMCMCCCRSSSDDGSNELKEKEQVLLNIQAFQTQTPKKKATATWKGKGNTDRQRTGYLGMY